MDEMERYYRESLLDELCKEWKDLWRSAHGDKEKLMRMVLMQQSAPHFATFCYKGRGLTKEYCKREFKDYINGRIFHDCDGVDGYTYAMYVDASGRKGMPFDVIQLLWCNDLQVIIPKTKCNRLYVSNRSTVNMTLDGYNHVSVYLFDESTLVVDDLDDESTVTVYCFSDDCKVVSGKYCFGKVNVFRKELRL